MKKLIIGFMTVIMISLSVATHAGSNYYGDDWNNRDWYHARKFHHDGDRDDWRYRNWYQERKEDRDRDHDRDRDDRHRRDYYLGDGHYPDQR